ncbi:MAG TPA: putative sulfate exporter family transporter [Thermoanaerobaculia bacterium]|nr:putative sulfate exporter family transporter [Thermoanaerobaculia bacterium]
MSDAAAHLPGTALAFHRKQAKVAIPWFILFFLLASVIRTYADAPQVVWDTLERIARIGLTVTLFLIGSSLSRASLAKVGVRPLILGIVLWVLISAAGLWSVRALV